MNAERFEPHPGATIAQAYESAVARAKEKNVPVEFMCRGRLVTVNPGDDAASLWLMEGAAIIDDLCRLGY